MLQIGIDDYSLNDDEEALAWTMLEFFEKMNDKNTKILLNMTLVEHKLSVDELIVLACCTAYEKAMTSYVSGQNELGIVTAHQMQNYIDNAEVYAQSDGFVEMLWGCLNRMMDER